MEMVEEDEEKIHGITGVVVKDDRLDLAVGKIHFAQDFSAVCYLDDVRRGRVGQCLC